MTNAVAGIVSVAVIQQGKDRIGLRHTEIAGRLRARLDFCETAPCRNLVGYRGAVAGSVGRRSGAVSKVSINRSGSRRHTGSKYPPGARFAHVAADLAAHGIIEQPRAWVLYARWKGVASGIKAGEYEIEPGGTPRTLLDKMVSGQVLLHSFTIVDGWRVQEMLLAFGAIPTSPSRCRSRLST